MAKKDGIFMSNYRSDKWGNRFWYNGDLIHREDGPAIEMSNGNREWWIDGRRHREDGPAVECYDGTKRWYKDGYLHRDDGPAIEFSNGGVSWYIDGIKLHHGGVVNDLVEKFRSRGCHV